MKESQNDSFDIFKFVEAPFLMRSVNVGILFTKSLIGHTTFLPFIEQTKNGNDK